MYSKLFQCNIHKSIRVSGLALKIINTPEFQRLRNIKQLGIAEYVFPTASHTRFEHSIGVYHLADKMITEILNRYPNKTYNIPAFSETPVKLDCLTVECIKIAGLCHDIGHGPFSHMFDDLLKNVDSENKHHEIRSCLIVDILCKRELKNELTDKHINFIKSLINPDKTDTGALYQIVANNLNGIDVDKFDYLIRDSENTGSKISFSFERLIKEFIIDNNNNIVYPKHCALDIYELFNSRYLMHKKVYNHKTVMIINSMYSKILKNVDALFGLTQSIYDMSLFCKFTDDTIYSYLQLLVNPPKIISLHMDNDLLDKINKTNKLYNRVQTRNLYNLVLEIKDSENAENYLNVTIDKICVKYPAIKQTDFIVKKSKIGFVSGDNPDPFNSIYFYNNIENENSFKIDKKNISALLNNNIQEIKWYLIYKKSDHIDTVLNEVSSQSKM